MPPAKPDHLVLTRNKQGMPTDIIDANGEHTSIVYFGDGVSVRSMSIDDYKRWRKSDKSDDWYTKAGDQIEGPEKLRIYLQKDDAVVEENLEESHHFVTTTRTDGTMQLAINGTRYIEYDREESPFQIIDGPDTWKLTNRTKNEWTSNQGEVENIAVNEGGYSYKDSQGFIHDFPITGGQRLVKTSDESAVLNFRNISNQFRDIVSNAIGELPQSVIDLLAHKGDRILAGESIITVFPELKNMHPHGWPSSWTWDRADGVFRSELNTVEVSEKVFDGTRTVFSVRAGGVARHETGHAVDRALGQQGQDFSSTQAFVDAYRQDVAKVSARDKANNAYVLQPGVAGPSEAFAEVFASMYGGPVNAKDDELVARSFPEVRRVIEARIRQLQQQGW
jgi:hypothetical protein